MHRHSNSNNNRDMWEKKEPKRMFVVGFSAAIYMGAAVLFGEGNRLNEPLSEGGNSFKNSLSLFFLNHSLITSSPACPNGGFPISWAKHAV